MTPEQLRRLRGLDGRDGEPGRPGERGERGERGQKGEKGDPGKDADLAQIERMVIDQVIRHRPADGLNGERGERGERGPRGVRGERGERGEKGDAGANGSDLALVPALATFVKDKNKLTTRVDVVEMDTGAPILSIVPIHESGLMVAAQIIPA